MKKEPSGLDPSFLPVVAAFAHDRSVVRKRAFSVENALTVNGKIFAMLAKGQFVAKLPRGRVDELVRDGVGERFDPGHGRLMKEWIAVRGGQAIWIALAREAHRFVLTGL